MLEQLEDRLQNLENALGAEDVQSADVNIPDLRKNFAKKGFNHVFKVDASKLRTLKEFANKPDGRPLSEKISIVQSCEELMRRRAGLLEEFEGRLNVILNTNDLSGISVNEEKLYGIEKDIEKALSGWKQNTVEIEEFRKEYATIVSGLQSYISVLSDKVAEGEVSRAKATSSEA